MLNRFIYDYIYQNKNIILIYMGYKQKMRKIKQAQLLRNLKIMREAEEKRILDEWVVIKNNVIKSESRIAI